MTIDAHAARLAPAQIWDSDQREAYYDRVRDIVSPAFHQRRVLVMGVGGGSYFAVKLARLGPAELRLADFDHVEWSNLCRTAYEVDDMGAPKVEALARLIGRANPFVATACWPVDVCALTEEESAALLEGIDLIVAGTDSFSAQARANTLSLHHDIPAVFIGVHAGAHGGRVIWSIPGETACYRCIAPERYDDFARDGERATDLPAAAGALVDVQLIDMVALKVSLAILERGQESALGRFWEQLGRRNEVIIRTSPDYAYGSLLWDAILADLPTTPKPFARELQEQVLFAVDTVWFSHEPNPACPECGGATGRSKGS